MEPSGISSLGRRVVILASPLALEGVNFRPGEDKQLLYVCVGTAYEAAAEVLSAPAVVLVIELRLLGRRHLRLLQIARDMNVELLAFGSLPAGMSSEELAGVRLISKDDIPDVIEQTAARGEIPTSAADVGAEAKASGPPEPLSGADEDIQPDLPRSGEGVYQPVQREDVSADKTDVPPAGRAADAQHLLTPEELAALLGDSP